MIYNIIYAVNNCPTNLWSENLLSIRMKVTVEKHTVVWVYLDEYTLLSKFACDMSGMFSLLPGNSCHHARQNTIRQPTTCCTNVPSLPATLTAYATCHVFRGFFQPLTCAIEPSLFYKDLICLVKGFSTIWYNVCRIGTWTNFTFAMVTPSCGGFAYWLRVLHYVKMDYRPCVFMSAFVACHGIRLLITDRSHITSDNFS